MKAEPVRLEQYVREIALELSPRDAGHVMGLNRTATFIYRQFQNFTRRVVKQSFSVNGLTVSNIRAFFGPETEKRFVVGAHYDTAGPLPGADDNASGVAGVLELSRLIENHDLPMMVELVSYPLEEPPFFYSRQMGSYIHAQSLKKQKIPVCGMLSLEMIGYFTDEPGSQSYPLFLLRPFFPTSGNFIAVVGNLFQRTFVKTTREAMHRAARLPVESINAPKIVPGISLSDHLNYWRMGYNAAMVTDTAMYRNPNYHSAFDTPDTLDYSRMAQVVDGVLAAVLEHCKRESSLPD